jgi:hypothetical protein
MTCQPRIDNEYDVAMHMVITQSAGLLLAAYLQPMTLIPQTLHA